MSLTGSESQERGCPIWCILPFFFFLVLHSWLFLSNFLILSTSCTSCLLINFPFLSVYTLLHLFSSLLLLLIQVFKQKTIPGLSRHQNLSFPFFFVFFSVFFFSSQLMHVCDHLTIKSPSHKKTQEKYKKNKRKTSSCQQRRETEGRIKEKESRKWRRRRKSDRKLAHLKFSHEASKGGEEKHHHERRVSERTVRVEVVGEKHSLFSVLSSYILTSK